MSGNFKRSFLFNLIVVLLLCIGLYILFFTSLSWLTHHGEEIRVPKLIGMDMRQATEKLDALSFDVYIDSTYEPKQKPFTVLAQMPEVGSSVKQGRTIFLTVNKAVPPTTPMPNLIGLSYRSAEMLLRNNKLVLGDTSYKPDIAKGAVLEQKWNNADVRPGQMIPMGAKISLVIGDGLGVTQFNVPDVIGMTTVEGISYLTGSGLQYTLVSDGDINDTATAIIYNETPKPFNELGAPNRIKAGDIVDLRIKQNPTPEEMQSNRNGANSVNRSDTGTQKPIP